MTGKQLLSKMVLKRYIIFILCTSCSFSIFGSTIFVDKNSEIKTIKSAIVFSKNGDTIVVNNGHYLEGNIIVDKEVTLIGKGFPVLDGQKKYEILSITASNVTIQGFIVQHSGYATLDDPCAIKIYDSRNVCIMNNRIIDNFFGVYLQYSKNCLVKNNYIEAFGVEEQLIGNGIHCWKSDSLQIIGNTITGHRDGIYFEFVTHSVIWKNNAYSNIRYGLHFMFSHNDAYITNTFRNNGAGVSVMFTNKVIMIGNIFDENWGDAAYGLLLKEISDSYIINNKFVRNTSGIFMEGTNRIVVEKNEFYSNGWGMKIQASCMDNTITANNFIGNTFDIATNGTLVLNTFNGNYWDKYEGYDINKDKIGDIPYHPISLFSIIVEKNPPAMLLFRSFMITLLDKSEKMMPSLTPEQFYDSTPLMRSIKL